MNCKCSLRAPCFTWHIQPNETFIHATLYGTIQWWDGLGWLDLISNFTLTKQSHKAYSWLKTWAGQETPQSLETKSCENFIILQSTIYYCFTMKHLFTTEPYVLTLINKTLIYYYHFSCHSRHTAWHEHKMKLIHL